MNARALRYSRFDRVEDFLRQGWMPLIPNAAMHHHHYGIELAWLCACPVPGGFKTSETNSQGVCDERATSGT